MRFGPNVTMLSDGRLVADCGCVTGGGECEQNTACQSAEGLDRGKCLGRRGPAGAFAVEGIGASAKPVVPKGGVLVVC